MSLAKWFMQQGKKMPKQDQDPGVAPSPQAQPSAAADSGGARARLADSGERFKRGAKSLRKAFGGM